MGFTVLDKAQTTEQTHYMENYMKHLKVEYGSGMHRGLIYVIRQVNGVYVPLRLERQWTYKEWLGCFSAM
jgi:hypothetical protein